MQVNLEDLEEEARRLAARVRAYDRIFVSLFLHEEPLGLADLDGAAAATADQLAGCLCRAVEPAIRAHLAEDGVQVSPGEPCQALLRPQRARCKEQRSAFSARAPFVSVILPTRNRPQHVASCLRELAQVQYPEFELIVVDNGASSDATAEVVAAYRGPRPVRYVREAIAGISRARNRGLELAQGPIVAFVDDDARPNAHWLTELAAGFEAADNVGCVTGLVLPLELETPAQIWFEQMSRLGKGFSGRVFDLRENRPDDILFPYSAGSFGAGANFAFRTSILKKIGGFDTALGAGTQGRGGEDLDVCFRLINRGYRIVYRPRSYVHHVHPRDYAAVKDKAFNYGAGFSAFLLKCLLADPRRLISIVRRSPFAISHLFSQSSPKNQSKGAEYPDELKRAELAGLLYGPVGYVNSLRTLAAQANELPALPLPNFRATLNWHSNPAMQGDGD